MDIIKIIGIALVSLIIIILLKQYKPEYAIYVSILAGILILVLIMDKLTRNHQLNKINFRQNICKHKLHKLAHKNNRNSISFRIRSQPV